VKKACPFNEALVGSLSTMVCFKNYRYCINFVFIFPTPFKFGGYFKFGRITVKCKALIDFIEYSCTLSFGRYCTYFLLIFKVISMALKSLLRYFIVVIEARALKPSLLCSISSCSCDQNLGNIVLKN
jgi:hypothetical protein